MYKSFFHNNYKISYQKFGRLKPAAVLIHGFPEDGTVFENQYNFLKKHYTIIVPDLPGSGKSDYNENLLSVENFAVIIKQILDEEKIESCFLFGHSMGGYISLAFANKYPKYLLGLGLVNSTTFTDTEERKTIRKKSINIMRKYGGFFFLKTMIPNLFSDSYLQNHQDVVDRLIAKGKRFKTETLIQYYTIMMKRKDRTNLLKKLKIPFLFIIGEKDKSIPLEDSLQQSHIPEKCFATMLSNAAHMSFLEDSEKVNKAILHFIQSFI